MRFRVGIGDFIHGLLVLATVSGVILIPGMGTRWAFAQTAAPASEALRVECSQLRTALSQANTEIAALKSADRGMRDDFRLRNRMAEAEALARRLTDAEAKLRHLDGTESTPHPIPMVTPVREPSDGPAELEAKAAVLADHARWLDAEADALGRAADRLRVRRTLQRRSNQLERDPFIGLDGSKRSMVYSAAGPDGKNTVKGSGTTGTTDTYSPTGTSSETGTSVTPVADSIAKNGVQGGSPTAFVSQSTASGPRPSTSGSYNSIPESSSSQNSMATLEFRRFLDAGTLAEINRLASSGRPDSAADALQKAAAALRAKSSQLKTQAAGLGANTKR